MLCIQKKYYGVYCAVIAMLLAVQFSGCAQVDQVKTAVGKEVALEAADNAMAEENHAEAAVQYRKAAEAGNAEAAYYLGLLYAGGGDVSKNEADAVKWMRMASEKGYAPAQEYLGMWCLGGIFVPQDLSKAAHWFNKAADQGNSSAMFFLGTMSAKGLGVPRDYNASLGWFQMANAKGFSVPPECLTLEGIAALDREYQSSHTPAQKPVVKTSPATIRTVQDGLTQLGYKPGPVDGMMGKRTARAIRAFQNDVGMPVDGNVSEALMRRIDERLKQQ